MGAEQSPVLLSQLLFLFTQVFRLVTERSIHKGKRGRNKNLQ